MTQRRIFVNSHFDKASKNISLAGTSFLSEWLNDPATQAFIAINPYPCYDANGKLVGALRPKSKGGRR